MIDNGTAGHLRTRTRALLAVVAGAIVAALRLLGTQGFSNDHFYYLSRAEQFLLGARPVRDFVDPGFPLMWALSALAQALGGRTLLSEAMLVAVGFGAAATITFWLIARWTGRLTLAFWATFVELAVMPRSYSYPKILMYAAAAAAFLHYARKPGTRSILLLAVVIAIAFLFRHDHGAYIGVGAFVLVAGMGGDRGLAGAARRLGLLVGLSAILVAPYLLYVQSAGGLIPYFQGAMRYAERDATRTSMLALPTLQGLAPFSADGLSVMAYYVFWAVPLVAMLVAWAAAGRRDRASAWTITALSVMTLIMNPGILRDPLTARVPDAIVPFAVLTAWLCAEALRSRPLPPIGSWLTRGTATVVIVITAIAAARIGNFADTLDRAEMLHRPPRPGLRWREVSAQLREPYAERQMPSDTAFALVPFFQYVRACTPDTARIFVSGYVPEVNYYAQRGFAAGHAAVYRGYYSSDADQRDMIERMQRELVLYVVASPDGVETFAESFPLVNAYVQEHFLQMADFPVDGFTLPARVWVNKVVAPVPTYGTTGWPCPGPRL